MRGVDRNGVEDELCRGQQLERFEHAVLQQPTGIWFVADEMADADQLAAARFQSLDRARRGVGVGQRQPADDAAHEVDLLAEIETFLGLAADLMQHLDQHGSLDAGARELGAQIVRGEIARKAVTDRVGPGIGVPA